jgi:hypothetical protein
MRPVRVFGAVVLASTLSCSSRQSVPVAFISSDAPPSVQVSDGYRVVDVAQPRLSGDSVSGLVNGREVAIPLRRVQSITTVRFSSARTVLLIGGVVAIGGLMAYAVTTEGEGELKQCDYSDEQNLSDLCRIQR